MEQQPASSPVRVRFGPAGWSYADWAGVVYPQPQPRGFKPLAYLARYFDTVEVNSTFYRIPPARMTASWVPQVPPEFRFAFKVPQTFTHERTSFPGQLEIAAFEEALAPVRQAGLLGPLLIQFPWSFRYGPEAVERLQRLAGTFAGYERFIEVRHRSWAEPEALAQIAAAGGYCNIDQPRLRDCLPPTQHVLGGGAYVRLHGRNARAWFASDVPRYERYNYLYTSDELREWVARLEQIATQAYHVYVIANNHYRGQAPANALELRALLERRRVAVPEPLLRAFPRLHAVTLPPREPSLFET